MSFNGWPCDVKDVNEYWCKHAAYKQAELGGKRNLLFEHEGKIQELADSLMNMTDSHQYMTTLLAISFTAISVLDLVGIDPEKAWDAFIARNMTVYVNPDERDRLGLPTIMEVAETEHIDHIGNMGQLGELLNVDDTGC